MVEVVLDELLPHDRQGRSEVQAAAAFLSRAVPHPEIAGPLVAAGDRLKLYLAEHIRAGQPDPPPGSAGDAKRDAAGLLALADRLIAHLFTGPARPVDRPGDPGRATGPHLRHPDGPTRPADPFSGGDNGFVLTVAG